LGPTKYISGEESFYQKEKTKLAVIYHELKAIGFNLEASGVEVEIWNSRRRSQNQVS
jgi:hypothetical protein